MIDSEKPVSSPLRPTGARGRGERQHAIVRTFMTQDMADKDILTLATGREQELDRILDAIGRSHKAAPGALQHIVLYGNRGFGKSFMTRHAQIKVAERWPDTPFLLLPEEQHSLQRDPHALLDTIKLKLSDSRSGGDTTYQEGHFRWPTAEEADNRWEEAEAGLEQALDASLPDGGIAIVVVENFDTLLRRLFHKDANEQRLRRWLDRPGNRIMLFATATGTVDMDYDRPLFHAFESVRLGPWSGDECIAYFNRLRAHQGLEPLEPEREAKARAVADFIGGAPRLAQLLGDVLETEDALDVAEIMAALTDRLADYYRRRIEDLAPLSIGLLDALIRGGEPASQTELAARVGAGGQSDIARVMSELQRADIIRGLPAPKSRERLYQVPDRIFVHYYRLRQGSREAQETPLATILDFLKSFYSRDEQRHQSLRHLEAGRLPEAGLFSRLACEGEKQRIGSYTRNFGYYLSLYLDTVPGAIDESAEDVVSLLEECPERAYGLYLDEELPGAAGAVHAVIHAQALNRLGHTGEACKALEAALGRAQGDPTASFIVLEQLTFLVALHESAEAARLAERFMDFDEELTPHMQARSIRHLAWRLINLGRYSDGLEATERAATLASELGDVLGEAVSLRNQAFSLNHLGRYEEAVDTASRAAECAAEAGDTTEEAVSLRHRTFSLGQLGRHEEAVETASRAAKYAAELGDIAEEAVSLRYRAFSLGQLGRHEEAWTDAKKSAGFARAAADRFNLSWAILECLQAAAHLSRPEVVSLFAEWLQLSAASEAGNMPHPRFEFGQLFPAVARAGAWPALDDLIETHAVWLAELEEPIWFHLSDGAAFAQIAAEKGRAAGYEALAATLPRIAKIMACSPKAPRICTWLPNIISGFSKNCRDPGLLRDVATLMTPDLAPQAEETARLLNTLAAVDEAETPETVLARTDPDIAIMVRRLRDIPDPELTPSRKKARGGKRT